MNFWKFLKDHLFHVGAFVLGLVLLNLVIWLDPSTHFRLNSLVYLDVLGLVFMFLFLVLLYWSRQAFFKELEIRTKHPDKSYEEPLDLSYSATNQAYENAYNAIVRYSKQSNDDLLTQITDQDEYIQTWIHEIKVPIAAMQLLQEAISDQIDPKRRRQLKNELSRIESLVEQVLYYSRLDNFSQDYLIQRYSLKKIVKATAIANMDYLLSKKIQFKLVGDDEVVLTDEKWLKYILQQIFSNAIKYTPEGGTITASLQRHESRVNLSITDTGIGIPEEDVPRIFDRGFTGQNGRKQNEDSTGLGLFLAKKMTQKLGHQISVQSTVNVGTTFTLTFPFLSYYNEKGNSDNIQVSRKS